MFRILKNGEPVADRPTIGEVQAVLDSKGVATGEVPDAIRRSLGVTAWEGGCWRVVRLAPTRRDGRAGGARECEECGVLTGGLYVCDDCAGTCR